MGEVMAEKWAEGRPGRNWSVKDMPAPASALPSGKLFARFIVNRGHTPLCFGIGRVYERWLVQFMKNGAEFLYLNQFDPVCSGDVLYLLFHDVIHRVVIHEPSILAIICVFPEKSLVNGSEDGRSDEGRIKVIQAHADSVPHHPNAEDAENQKIEGAFNEIEHAHEYIKEKREHKIENQDFPQFNYSRD